MLNRRKYVDYILLLVILFLSALTAATQIFPFNNRFSPIEPDDSYVRILKSVQMKECFLQDCPGLASLHHQFETLRNNPTADQIQIFEGYARFLLVYSPLNSIVLNGLEATGLSIEEAQNILASIGGLLFFSACAYWLVPIFGHGATALTLVLIIGMQLPSYGVSSFPPNNLSLAVGLWLWGFILRSKGDCGPQLVLGVLISCSLHQIGKVWMAATLLLYFSYLYFNFNRKRLIYGCISILVIGIFLLLPSLASKPMMAYPAMDLMDQESLSDIFRLNSSVALKIVIEFLKYFDGMLPIIFLLSTGLLSTLLENKDSRSSYLLMLLMLTGLTILSLFIFFPYGSGGEIFARIWVPFVILLTATACAGLLRLFVTIKSLLKSYYSHQEESRSKNEILVFLAILLTFSVSMIDHISSNIFVYSRDFPQLIRHKTDRLHHFLDTTQVKILQQDAKDSRRLKILYNDIESAVFYLSKGALHHDALYLPPVLHSSLAEDWIGEGQGVTHFVRRNPNIPNNRGFLIGRDDRFGFPLKLGIQFLEEAKNPQTLRLRLANLSNEKTVISLHLPSKIGEKRIVQEKTVPPHWMGWWQVEGVTWSKGAKLTLETADSSRKAYLLGVRIGGPNSTNTNSWPWDQPLSILHPLASNKEIVESFSFESSKLWNYDDRKFDIADDSGQTILLKFRPLKQ